MIAKLTREAGSGAPQPLISVQDIRELNRLAALSPALALRRALPLVGQLARVYADLLAAGMPAVAPPGRGGGPEIVHHVEGRAGAWWLGYFLWAPGAATPIDDHTGWGLYACAGGTLLEERYRRLDDGAQPNCARLRLGWRRRWGQGDSSRLLPYEGGIHRVANVGAQPALSVHLYGPRLGPFDGRDYDPARDYVCDRLE